MRLQGRSGLFYGILVVLIMSMGIWWTYFLIQEGHHYERYHLQRFTTDRLHAHYLIQTVPGIAENPAAALQESFPHLVFNDDPSLPHVEIDPRAIAEVREEAARRRRMFITEGIFFLMLLMAGTTILTLAQRRERRYERLRELFLAGATHELKTPLASLRLYTETLQRSGLSDDARARIRGTMLQDVDRLESMVDQVLSVSREREQDRGPAVILDLGEEVSTILSDMGPFLQAHGARVESDLPAGHLIEGNIDALGVAVRNLVRNAVVHSPPPARVRIGLVRDGDDHRLSITDQGPGIPRRERRKIFDSFYRTAAEPGDTVLGGKGSGLGLYLVERNTRSLGGRIELESEEGRGSTFSLLLPAVRGEDS